MKSRTESRPSVSGLPVRTSEQLKVPFRKPEQSTAVDTAFRTSEQDAEPFRKPEDDGYGLASVLFDEALKGSGLTNQEVAFLVTVSESLVQKWRSAESRACPSFAQLLRLPPSFHIALHRVMNKRYGFGRAALRDLLEAAGSIAALAE